MKISMLPHVTAVCKSSFFHLRNIFKIRKFLSYDTCKTLIHAFVTARIDYCNSLLYGQPKCILKRLQSVLNSAARLIHLTSRYEHVTPLLIQLHWLPIEQRITFKIAVIIFTALHGAAPTIGDKMSWDISPKTGLFYVLLTSKGGNIAFLPHPLRVMLCPCSSYL